MNLEDLKEILTAEDYETLKTALGNRFKYRMRLSLNPGRKSCEDMVTENNRKIHGICAKYQIAYTGGGW